MAATRQSTPNSVCHGSSGCGSARHGVAACAAHAHDAAWATRKPKYLHEQH